MPNPVATPAATMFDIAASLRAAKLIFPAPLAAVSTKVSPAILGAPLRATLNGRSGLKNGINISGTTEETGVPHGNREGRGDASSEAEKRNGKRGTHYCEYRGRR